MYASVYFLNTSLMSQYTLKLKQMKDIKEIMELFCQHS